MCAQYTSTWSVPSRRRLPSAAAAIAVADRPSAESRVRSPGTVGRPPHLVLSTIRSRLPRAASQRPMASSLSSPVAPSFQNG